MRRCLVICKNDIHASRVFNKILEFVWQLKDEGKTTEEIEYGENIFGHNIKTKYGEFLFIVEREDFIRGLDFNDYINLAGDDELEQNVIIPNMRR